MKKFIAPILSWLHVAIRLGGWKRACTMDIENLSDIVVWIDKEMNDVLGLLYKATRGKLEKADEKKSVQRAELLLEKYESLKVELKGGKLEAVTAYERDMLQMRGYLKKLGK
ncbi:MAG: hypothetical protein AB8G17_18970 [Gammaproteobacteria bacterium]